MRAAFRKSLSFRKQKDDKQDGTPTSRRNLFARSASYSSTKASSSRRSLDPEEAPAPEEDSPVSVVGSSRRNLFKRSASSSKALSPSCGGKHHAPKEAPPPRAPPIKKKTSSPQESPVSVVLSQPAPSDNVQNEIPPCSSNEEQELHTPCKQQARQHFTTPDPISQAAAALDDAGNTLFQQGDYDSAFESYTRALKLKRQSLSVTKEHPECILASVATSINNIGYLRQRSGATPEVVMAAYRDSLEIKKELFGNHHLSVGKTLNNIGSVYFSTGDLDHAMEAYVEAKDIMEQKLGSQHLDIATVCSNIGDVYMALQSMQEAHGMYKEALKIRWTNLSEHDPKVMRLLEKIAAIEMEQTAFSHDSLHTEDGRFLEEEDDEEPVQVQLHNLHTEVEADIKEIGDMQRMLALDMVKDKLKILKGMRDIDTIHEVSTTTPLTPDERKDALDSVKERLAQLRERKKDEECVDGS